MSADYRSVPLTLNLLPPALHMPAVLCEDEPSLINAVTVPVLKKWPQLTPIIAAGCAYHPTAHDRQTAMEEAIDKVMCEADCEVDAQIRLGGVGAMRVPPLGTVDPKVRVAVPVRAIRLANPTGEGFSVAVTDEDLKKFLCDQMRCHSSRFVGLTNMLFHQLHALVWGLRAGEVSMPPVLAGRIDVARKQVEDLTGLWWAPSQIVGGGRLFHPLSLTLATVWMHMVYRDSDARFADSPMAMLQQANVIVSEEQCHLIQAYVSVAIESAAGAMPALGLIAETMNDRFRSW